MNLLAKFYGAASSFRFYRFVIHERGPATVRYFLLLIALLALALTVRRELKILDISAEVAEWMVANLPEITIQDGQVTSSVEQPFVLRDDKVGVFILDTTGKTVRIDSTYDRGFLLTKNKLIVKQPRGGRDVGSVDLSQFKLLKVNEQAIRAWQKFFYWVTFPFVFFGTYLEQGFLKLFLVLLFSLSTLSLARRGSFHFTWRQILILGIYALTPVVVYEIFLALSGMNEVTIGFLGSEVPPFFLVSLILYLLFLWGGTRACREI